MVIMFYIWIFCIDTSQHDDEYVLLECLQSLISNLFYDKHPVVYLLPH